MKKHNKFTSGPFHIFNPIPQNKKEALQHGNALANSGNYPVGTTECFNVGISGGCGPECFVYLDGDCDEAQDVYTMLETIEEIKTHNEIYQSK